MHVYVEREINGKVRTESFVFGVVPILASSVLCFGLSYKDWVLCFPVMFTCWLVGWGEMLVVFVCCWVGLCGE